MPSKPKKRRSRNIDLGTNQMSKMNSDNNGTNQNSTSSLKKGKGRKKKKVVVGEDGLLEEFEIEPVNDKDPLLDSGTSEETSFSIAAQVFFPFLIAGLGMVGAGFVLDIVQHWKVFQEISEIFIMVPALLGLKGNLEMTLASRLSTHANLGNMDNAAQMWSMVFGNLSLVQCQAIVVGFLASLAAMVMGWIPDGNFNSNHALLLCASALVTASLASFVLGIIMVCVVLCSRRCNINPDNVATPIAASLGDLTTLGLLAWITNDLFNTLETSPWVAPTIIGCYLLSIPVWVILTCRNKHTSLVLRYGWTPVIFAMMISSVGGFILDFTVKVFKGVAVFQPVINGVGGNLVAVQASRLSTTLHQSSTLGSLPEAQSTCVSPVYAFCSKSLEAKTCRVLLALLIPGQLIFTFVIGYFRAGHTSITLLFVVVYLIAAFIQVMLLLYICHVMVISMWKHKIDPDNSAIPYLTALGDLLGTGFLALAFYFLYLVGDRDEDLGD